MEYDLSPNHSSLAAIKPCKFWRLLDQIKIKVKKVIIVELYFKLKWIGEKVIIKTLVTAIDLHIFENNVDLMLNFDDKIKPIPPIVNCQILSSGE